MINNDIELKATQERIVHFWKMVDAIRLTEKNPSNYNSSAGGFLAEIEKMNNEIFEYLSIHPNELESDGTKAAA